MLYPDDFEKKTGFAAIRRLIYEQCLCPLGQQLVESMSFSHQLFVIQQALDETAEMQKILAENYNFPSTNYCDLSASLQKARIEGVYLEPHELYDLRRSQETLKAVRTLIKKHLAEFPALNRLVSQYTFFPFVTESIDNIINHQAQVKDSASPQLRHIRENIRNKKTQISRKLEEILKQCKSMGITDDSANISLRDGKSVIPVNASDKRKLAGYIHDESESGKTCYIEPAAIVELNNDIRELENAEKRELIRILLHLTTELRPYIDDLLVSYRYLGIFDFIRAKAIVANMLMASKPQLSDAPYIKWIDARHPLLYLTLKKAGKGVVPLTLELNKSNRILLISGPNAGGKSVCLQTVGLLQYMCQCGMPVPVNEQSIFGVFDKLFISIGDKQSIEQDLSTYSSHLINMHHFIRHADNKSLILVDEFGSGTDPVIGGAIAEAILDEFIRKQCFGVITTHYSNLKIFATKTEGIINGAMLFDTQAMQPLFRLETGRAGSSFALEIAQKIGIPEVLLKKAEKIAGTDHIAFDEHLRQMAKDKHYWEEKRQQMRIASKQLADLITCYEKELAAIKEMRNAILQKAKKEAEEMLDKANTTIEHTIKIIKEQQAEKESTRKARNNLETVKKQLINNTNKDRQLEQKAEHIAYVKRRYTKEQKKESPTENITIEEGSMVRIKGQSAMGIVTKIKNDRYTVVLGSVKSIVSKDMLERVPETEIPITPQQNNTASYSSMTRKTAFSPEIDVRGKRADEALQLVQQFIDNAIMTSTHTLRILHDKGDGILRQVIRSYLKTEKAVHAFKDESEQFGGSGITLVEMNF